MNKAAYKCVKCGNNTFSIGEIRTTGTFLSKVFDVQHKKFSHITCERCQYTEFYRMKSSLLGNIFDLGT
ncbi:zinc ribbon domain-containing protein [Aureitalea marina]|uniref:GTP-binding protein n=1 Tax=Aureitalea marina TaxID=930804 RepID=A0A2S7KN30_9FLAO|nr:zinc ribbon domain-containing protein [Aureitalea marina]PQB04039.1 GTP-binding protein [Aureitalea marina]